MTEHDTNDTSDEDPLAITSILKEMPDDNIRISKWTCRLPRELMDKILSILADEKDAVSLRNLQSTSSAVYLVVSPYLYRQLTLETNGMFKLFRMFDDVVLDFDVFSLDYATINRHPIDMHLYHRLLWSLAFVRTIVLPEFGLECETKTFESYTNINAAMKVFRQSMWPALESVHLGESLDSDEDNHYYPFNHVRDVYTAMLPGLRPQYIHIEMPSVTLSLDRDDFAVRDARPRSFLCDLEAEQVIITNLTYDTHGIPHALQSLTIGYGEVQWDGTGLNANMALKCTILDEAMSSSSATLRQVTVIGFERGVDSASSQAIHAELLVSLCRYKFGQRDLFRCRIKPWGSGETGAWDVWHRIDEPFGDQ